ncbi:hypothetical protein NP233_g11503 [Leucocoprinus birnbaumii]|uniref:Uncharacterized protein n=1 Tax=Leucocoprinus birnbaumii TaxID=56174 RepID=A0AAD5YKD2_9AGAR|nr:hypothetical protein NP233_g11503 [Leucocoprinus birnbaumii]
MPGARFEGFDSISEACEEFCRLALLGKCRPLKRLPTTTHYTASVTVEDSVAEDSAVEDSTELPYADLAASRIKIEVSEPVKVEVSEPDQNIGSDVDQNMGRKDVRSDGSESDDDDLRWYAIIKGRRPGVYQGIHSAYEKLGRHGRCEVHVVSEESSADRIFRRRFMVGEIIGYNSRGERIRFAMDDDE